MLGKSSRFFKAGYTHPKYELPIGKASVFDWVLQSFSHYFQDELFLFLVREDYKAETFIKNRLKFHTIRNYKIMSFNQETRGQADSVYLGLQGVDSQEPVYIFNIDTIHFSFEKKIMDNSVAGYLEVFRGEGDHWSFVEPLSETQVARTTEKQRISDLCSNGLYGFKNVALFNEAFLQLESEYVSKNAELYIAPMYNYLIRMGYPIHYKMIDKVDLGFCGTPAEYEDFIIHQDQYSFK